VSAQYVPGIANMAVVHANIGYADDAKKRAFVPQSELARTGFPQLQHIY